MAYLTLFLLLICVPLGVAAQNIGLGLCAVVLFVQAALHAKNKQNMPLPAEFGIPLVLSILFLIVLGISAYMNPSHPAGNSGGKFIGGYLAWALLPALLVVAVPRLSSKNWERLAQTAAAVAMVLGLIALSQYVLGWRIEGVNLVPDGFRARGFYSHPLTLAYVSLIPFSFGLCMVVSFPRRMWTWLLLIGASLAMVFSFSKTVLAAAFCFAAICLVVKLRGKWRWSSLAILLVVFVFTAATKNPISQRFSHIKKGVDVAGDRIDDRLIFWDVAALMVKERPLIGHGPDLTTDYRQPYYKALGYADFKKQYEAHNLFLQVAVSGGGVALVLFIWWLGWYAKQSLSLISHPIGFAGLSIIVTFSFASLTQNSFQDSEVRFLLTLVCGFFWLFLRDHVFESRSEKLFDSHQSGINEM